MANHAFILIRYEKSLKRNKKFLFEQFIISSSLVVKYMIIFFISIKQYAFHFAFSDFKLLGQRPESPL